MPVSASRVMLAEWAAPNCGGRSAIGLPESVPESLSRWHAEQSMSTVRRPRSTRSGVTSTLSSTRPGV